MALKLLLLKSGEHIISDVKEGYLDDTLACYVLENPCKVIFNTNNIILETWPALSEDTTIELIPDWIITIVNPNIDLQNTYKDKTVGLEHEIN